MDNDIEERGQVRDNSADQQNARDDNRQREETLFDRRFEYAYRPKVESWCKDWEHGDSGEL